jgi:hypothetical protein
MFCLKMCTFCLPSTLLESSSPLSFEDLGPGGADSCLSTARGLAERLLAFDWVPTEGANDNATGTSGPLFRETVSQHTPPRSSEPATPPSPVPLPCAGRRAARRKKRKARFAYGPQRSGLFLLSES